MQLARTMAIELVLKTFISAQLVASVDDPEDQKQVNELARTFRDNALAAVDKQLAGPPDQNAALLIKPIVRDTITRLYDGAAKQVEDAAQLHFGRTSSRSQN